ncbi:MAG TPA: hypothetical protein PKD64_09040 [Pirellulaceae bacterium]|mgnify:CR=1 FL=1|nr:hypothetical protein [Pirellulaceae bacterium]HMO92332.1 hypothetical protein [Pirellulaceae bacterium]HMP69256.1 hypothetical protein [Pirellulaceae bacterium]
MFESWRAKLKKVDRLIAEGQLQQAVHTVLTEQLAQHRDAGSTIQRLVTGLACQAQRFASMGDFAGAWENLDRASLICRPELLDRLSKEKSRLVDLTVECAEQFVEAGKPVQATRTIAYLDSRRILDRRVDEIREVCRAMQQVEQRIAEGRLIEAAEKLEQIQRLKPKLDFLETRAQKLREQRSELSNLHGKLASAINQSNWSSVRQISSRMLQISPNYQIAVDAIRRCPPTDEPAHPQPSVEHKQEVFIGRESGNIQFGSSPKFIDATLVSEQHPTSPDSGQSGHRLVRPAEMSSNATPIELIGTQAEINSRANCDTQVGSSTNMKIELSSITDLDHHEIQAFMLWVDGVGGFWVCTKDSIDIGQEHLQGQVDIPIQGDLGSNRARINRIRESYVLHPMATSNGGIQLDGQCLQADALLEDNQLIQIGKARIRFHRPHPLSNSAILRIASRHRTTRWSDAIILMGDTLILGPDPKCHIVCPDLLRPLIIFRRKDGLYVKYDAPMTIDGIAVKKTGKISENSAINTENLAVALERIE